jgi:hypothetical protein
MSVKTILDNYLGKNSRITQKDMGNGDTQVCDLDTGDCYVVKVKDGLIERFDNSVKINRKVQVETPVGVKQLLRD